MDSSPQQNILYYAINLESATERRAQLVEQARQAGIDLRIIPAYVGATLTEEEMSGYDRALRKKLYSKELKPGEIGCYLSHLRALREFVSTGEPYAVIMEDDVMFTPLTKPGLEYIVNHTEGWQVVKLFSRRGKTHDITPANAPADAPVRFIYPRKIYWATVAILYTREAAIKALELCSGHYWLAWDAQLSYELMENDIPYCAVDPDIIVTSDPDNAASTIGNGIEKSHYDSIAQYIRRRLFVMRTSRHKKAMLKLMQNRITIR